MTTKPQIDDFDIVTLPQKHKFAHEKGNNGSTKCPLGIDESVSMLHESFEILRVEQNNNFNHLTNDIGEIKNGMEKITNTILNPESGLYTRVKSVESWNGTISKIMWIVMTSAVGFLFTKMFLFK